MKEFKLIILLTTILSIFVLSCNQSTKQSNDNDITSKTDSIHADTIPKIIRGNDTIISSKYDCCFVITTMIKYPDSEQEIKGTILLLHGWNLPASEWCEKTTFCKKALAKGYVLIIPDYKKSNYTLEIYPQTNADYQKYPSIKWMINSQYPDLQKQFGLLLPGQNNLVAGISTGGRGATLLAYYMPEVFTGAASLSGDFDITSMQDEYLYYAFLGQYKDFPKRWEIECFAYDCKNYTVPTYIGHGKMDNVSPYTQSKAMYDSIIKYHPDLKLIGNFPEYDSHNYTYWESETDNVLNFFECCE